MNNIYLDFALEIAKTAGAIMKNNFVMNMKKERKSDNTPVTETDLAINNLIIEKIASNFPDHAVMWEEKSEEIISAKYMWICDPVDGTVPFSHWIPNSTFSLWLIENGQPIVAVVYDPFMDRLFYASKWNWAFINWKPIKVGNYDNLTNVLIWMEWRKWTKSIWNYSAINEYLTETFNCQVLKYNSIIYKWMLVACWEFWATMFPWKNPCDIVTVKLIVEEAGWKVTNLAWENDRYDIQWNCFWMIASNWILHNELLNIVKQNLNMQK